MGKNNKQGHLILLAGASGVGKSTFSKLAFPGALVVSSDDWRGVLYGDEAAQKNHALTFRMVDREIRNALRAGETVICDQTALSPFARKGQLRLAEQTKANVEMILISGELSELREGQASRAAIGGRTVPDEVVVQQHAGAVKLEQEIQNQKVEGFSQIRVVQRKNMTSFPVKKTNSNPKQQAAYRNKALEQEYFKIKTEYQSLCSQIVQEGLADDAQNISGLTGLLGEYIDSIKTFLTEQIDFSDHSAAGALISLAWDNLNSAMTALKQTACEEKDQEN